MDFKLFSDLIPEFDEYLLDLHTAASIGCEERVRDIIESSESKHVINKQNKKGWTPLMYAACCANLKVVLFLLEEGADINLKNNQGYSALTLASKCGSTDIVSLLVDNGANVNDQDLKGWSALFHATAFGHRSVIQLLIEKGAIADLVGGSQNLTPLMLSAAAGHEMIVKDLLQFGVNPTTESNTGETARSLAVKNGHVQVKALIDAHLYSKKYCHQPNVHSSDLQSLLRDLQLSKYYYIFEAHEIDIDTFWRLSDEDLREIGIQLLGPRKKMCSAIARWHESRTLNGKCAEKAYISRLNTENQRLQQQLMEVKSLLSREKDERKAAERKLNDGIQTLKNFTDTVHRTIGSTILLQNKLRESHINLRNWICGSTQAMSCDSNWGKPDTTVLFQLVDYMGKLIEDIYHQTVLSLQQTDFR